MKAILRYLLAAPLFAVTISEGAELYYGPPASPLSWSAAKPQPGATFSPPSGILGVLKLPASVKLVDLTDQRSYGEPRQQLVWLARYESLTVRCDRGTASIALSLAF